MDEQKYSPLSSAVQAVADPRKARGQRQEWDVIMGVIAAALARGPQNGRASGPWVPDQADELIERLRPARKQRPSPSTLRRARRAIDLRALEGALAACTEQLRAPEPPPAPSVTPSGGVLAGLAVDGTAVRDRRTVEQGHGRLETRTLQASIARRDYFAWPGVEQVMRRQGRRVITTTGQLSEQTTYATTSLPRSLAGTVQLEVLWRAHWISENRDHDGRDVTFGEDASRIRLGQAPRPWRPSAMPSSACAAPTAGATSLTPSAITVPRLIAPYA